MSNSTPERIVALLEKIPEDTTSLTIIQEVKLMGQFLWELVGRSIGRLILIFAAVFAASWLPAAVLVLLFTYASQTYTRTGLFIVAAICLIPLAGLASFNFTAYRGLRDIVNKLAFGQKIGAGLVAVIEPLNLTHIPLDDFTDRIKSFLTQTRAEVPRPEGTIRRLAFRGFNAVIFFAARFTLNRLAKDCVVDGKVDLERFAAGVGERADGILISYFKTVLWDLTRGFLVIGTVVVLILVIAITQIVKLIP
ncbi:MAG: hypothetical protein AAF593_00875 [Planctomycetota bacterium]